MHEPTSAPNRWRESARRYAHSRRLRRAVSILGVALLLYALLGFFALPAYLKHYAHTRAGALLGRPLSVQTVRFNPFTLKLEADRLHVAEPDGRAPFVDLDKLVVNASWRSLFRLAPVLDALELDRPRLAIVRTAAQRFNFSDLIDRFAGGPKDPQAKPARFALSNIVIHGGEIRFDDKVQNASHRIDQLELGVPFIANLPRDTDVFVQPLLAFRADGSPLRIQGQTKPFASSLESSVDFHLDRLDLARYLAYVPAQLPVAIPRGQLSGDLKLSFLDSQPSPQLRLGGQLAVDDFVLTARGGAPIAEVGHASATLADVQPLISRYRLGTVKLDGATLHYAKQAGGHSNFDPLIGGGAPPAPSSEPPPTEVGIAELSLSGSRFAYLDASGSAPATLTLDGLSGTISALDTLKGTAAVDVRGQLNGGSAASNGKLDLAAGRYAGTLALKNVDIVPLQALAAPDLAAALQQGKLDADGSLQATWHDAVNVHLEPAKASLRDFALGRRGGKESPIAWRRLDTELLRFDLAGNEARLGTVHLQGLRAQATRERDGKLDLASLTESRPAPGTPPRTAAPAWHWSLERFSLDDGALELTDRAGTGKPAVVKLDGLKGQLEGLAEAMRKPLKLALTGNLGKGGFDASGNLRPAPLAADLRIKTRQLDLARFTSYIDVPLNVNIVRAQLTSDGRLRYAAGSTAKMSYRGRATLGRVRIQDKLSGDDFARWNSLAVGGIDVAIGDGTPKLTLGDIALSDFYARVIVNANGRLNLADVAGKGAEQPVSVTRAENTPAPAEAKPAAPAPAASAAAPATPAAPAAQIQIGQITLARGQLNYTDNFIKPNYTANITQLTGKIGAFGTSGGPPAPVALQGQLDDNSPVDIGGSINPLAPVAYLDIKGKATGVELTHLSAYSSKYTGYPIIKGRLNADVSYLLDQGKLKADNHIFIDQLTFGDRVESPGVSHLPVKLAVALLKNSKGEIDVNVPVSGSLDDPQFSIGSLVWHAFVNLIGKAVTSPFRLLASAFGGSGSKQDLGYIEFAPGSAVLDDAAKAKLGQIVKVLTDKPSLNLDIIGRIDPSKDESGLRQVMVDDLVHQERGDDDDIAEGKTPPPMTPDQYEKYLERAYKHAKFPKPRNAIGLAKSQPSEEMKKMLEANMPVDQNALRQLAERRAEAVHGWLHGKIDDKRLFTVAPKLDAKGIDDGGKTTRVDFGLH